MITFRPGFFYIFSRHLLKVAMGQGQSEIAMKLLTDCARDGDWLCLKNLHLVTAWLPKLEKVRSSKVGIENDLSMYTIEIYRDFVVVFKGVKTYTYL